MVLVIIIEVNISPVKYIKNSNSFHRYY